MIMVIKPTGKLLFWLMHTSVESKLLLFFFIIILTHTPLFLVTHSLSSGKQNDQMQVWHVFQSSWEVLLLPFILYESGWHYKLLFFPEPFSSYFIAVQSQPKYRACWHFWGGGNICSFFLFFFVFICCAVAVVLSCRLCFITRTP